MFSEGDETGIKLFLSGTVHFTLIAVSEKCECRCFTHLIEEQKLIPHLFKLMNFAKISLPKQDMTDSTRNLENKIASDLHL